MHRGTVHLTNKIRGKGLTVTGGLGIAGSFNWVSALIRRITRLGEGSQTLMLLLLISGQVSQLFREGLPFCEEKYKKQLGAVQL